LIAITIIGIPLAMVVFLAYLLALIIAPIFAALCLGKYVLKKKQKNIVKPAAVGIVILAVLVAIPFIGGFVKLVVLLLGLGAITTALIAFFSKKKR